MQKKPGIRIVTTVAIIIVAAIIIFSSYTIVAPGHRGVVVMLGKVEQTVLSEGFHLILPPVVRQVVQVDVRTKKLEVNTEAASSDLQAIQCWACSTITWTRRMPACSTRKWAWISRISSLRLPCRKLSRRRPRSIASRASWCSERRLRSSSRMI
jgi:hypothetical protein